VTSPPARATPSAQDGTRRATVAPLFLAGFTTAFGAHSVAAVAGASAGDRAAGLLDLAALLAVYDLAEVLLKPFFGSLADRLGPKPVIVGGLVAFAAVSLIGVLASSAVVLVVVRFGQGAAASAFSPASSAAVARLTDRRRMTGAFGRYGSWKGLGYALGPIVGAAVVALAGWAALSMVLAGLAVVAAVWVVVRVPPLPPVPRQRAGFADLVRQSTSGSFLRPTLLLAATAGTVAAAVGFLPALGSGLGLTGVATTAAATVLAVASSLSQPFVGRLVDDGRLRGDVGIGLGAILIVGGLLTVALLPAVATLYVAAASTGLGVGLITPTAFARLAASAPHDRIGRTMGAAEVGRELGDAGAPALVGLVAVGGGLPAGLGVLALVVGLLGSVAVISDRLGRVGSHRPAAAAPARVPVPEGSPPSIGASVNAGTPRAAGRGRPDGGGEGSTDG
jgi:MFS family permease